MARFLLRRALQGLIVLLVVVTAVFVLSRVVVDPTLVLLPSDSTKEDYQRLKEKYGLDKPLYQQYFGYLGQVARGDLGESLVRTGYTTTEIIRKPLWNSTKLALAAIAVAFGLAFPLGIIAALNRGNPIDGITRFVAALGLVTPGWWLGLLLMILLGVKAGLVPIAGMGGISHYILPAFCLSLGAAAAHARIVRGQMLNVLNSEFVKMARARGLTSRAVIWKHALRNAIIPSVTFAGLYFGTLVTGAITIEVVFAWPGMGRLVFNSIGQQDLVVVQGAILVITLIVLVFNLLADIGYGLVDPRIRVN